MKNNDETETIYSVTDVKKSPMAMFELAKKKNTGIYIHNRKKVAGVMLSVDQYEGLVNKNKKTNEEMSEMKIIQLNQQIREKIAFGSLISTKNLDEHLAAIGFISKKNVPDDYNDMMNELNETGKIDYVFRKKEDRTNIFAEVIGEQSNQSKLTDKIIVKKIHVRVE